MMNHFFLTATIHFQRFIGRLCGIVWSSAISVQWITQFDDTYMADTDNDYHFMVLIWPFLASDSYVYVYVYV